MNCKFSIYFDWADMRAFYQRDPRLIGRNLFVPIPLTLLIATKVTRKTFHNIDPLAWLVVEFDWCSFGFVSVGLCDELE